MQLNVSLKLKNKDKVSFLFLLFFIFIFLVICVQNWMYLEYHLSEDISGETMYMVKVWETKDPFTPAYANSAESFFSRPWPAFIIFYSLTGNALISAKCTLITTTVCLALALGVLLKKAELGRNCVCVGLAAYFGLMASGSYTVSDMLFRYFNSYSMYHLCLLLTLILLLDENSRWKKSIFKTIVLLSVSFYFGLCGVKALLLIYFPIFAFEAIEAIYNKLEGKDAPPDHLILTGALVFANLIAIVLYYYWVVPHMMASPASLGLVSEGIFGSLGKSLTSLMTAFGINPNGETLTSVAALLTLYMLVLLAIDLFGVIYLNKKDSIPTKAKRLMCYALSSICFTALVCTISSYPAEPRYYLCAPFLTALMVALTYRYLRSRTDTRSLMALYCLFIFGGFGLIYIYIYIYLNNGQTAQGTFNYTISCARKALTGSHVYMEGGPAVSIS